MPITRDQLLDRFAKKRLSSIKLTWAQFLAELNAFTPADQTRMLAAVNDGTQNATRQAVAMLATAMLTKRLALAQAEVAAMVVSETFTIIDLRELLDNGG